jgi:hypothetical protein
MRRLPVKVLEATVTTRIRDPHRPPATALTQNDTFRLKDGYELELHASGLAVIIRGKDHTRLAPIASAVVVEDEPEAAVVPVRKAGKRP